ncbi:MAG: sugar ABC transporter permease [Clostridia bacterium]|nr:sugar ABC transporter permease [Clostridia bacterium]MCR4886885.1 sugar ABC transporter permease [Clostridiales bacterium]
MQKTPKRRLTRNDLVSYALLSPYLMLFSVFILVPVLMTAGLSFTNFDVINPPRPTGISNFVYLFTQDTVFMKFVLPNTFLYAIVVGVGGYVLSFLLAWMLAQIQALPRTLLSLCIYMPSMLGQVFISVIWRTIFSGDQGGWMNAILLQLGWIDQPIQFLLTGKYFMLIMIVVSLWSSMGIGFLSMISGILNINREIYEAAYIDGLKNRFQEIVHVTIPSMKPQMLFGAVMSITSAFNMGWIGVALAGVNPTPAYSGQLITNHIDDYGFIRYEMGYAASISVILLMVVYGFNLLAHRFFDEKD